MRCVLNMAIVICHKSESGAHEFVEIDCAIAAENIMLQAVSEGLGSVMIGVCPIESNMNNVSNILNLSNNLVPFTIIPIGYPVLEKKQTDRFDEEKVHYV